jgi:succinate-semialdehyde dehydrogenase/glutarate-semialdehyde dehydrogenase
LAQPADLDRALDAAARGYKRWRATSAHDKALVIAGKLV